VSVGSRLCISKAGFRPTRIVEWDRWCCDTIRENRRAKAGGIGRWPEPIEGDIRQIDFRAHEGKIDLVSGGPPCQPFSLGGKHRAHADTRDMWPEAVRVVRETRPRAFVFENVKGLTRASFATYLAHIVHQLTYPELAPHADEAWTEHMARLERHHTARGGRDGLRYNVVHRVLNAANHGVPQRRERVVFVGFRADLGIEWNFPDETHSIDALLWEQVRSGEYWERNQVALRDRVLDPRFMTRAEKLTERPETAPWRTVRDAISDLPDPETAPKRAALCLNHRFQAGARSYIGHTGSPLDEPAKTLKAGVHGVPGGENMLRRADGSVRYFSVRESARLQTFPDDYRFHGSWTESMRQLGNAVPVQLAEVIARNVSHELRAVVG